MQEEAQWIEKEAEDEDEKSSACPPEGHVLSDVDLIMVLSKQ